MKTLLLALLIGCGLHSQTLNFGHYVINPKTDSARCIESVSQVVIDSAGKTIRLNFQGDTVVYSFAGRTENQYAATPEFNNYTYYLFEIPGKRNFKTIQVYKGFVMLVFFDGQYIVLLK